MRPTLSGRSYVYQAMRVTGAGNIYLPVSARDSSGKLPQSVISKKAAAGYSSYGNQIGLATTHVQEITGASRGQRLEVGAVVGAVKAADAPRASAPGDRIHHVRRPHEAASSIGRATGFV